MISQGPGGFSLEIRTISGKALWSEWTMDWILAWEKLKTWKSAPGKRSGGAWCELPSNCDSISLISFSVPGTPNEVEEDVFVEKKQYQSFQIIWTSSFRKTCQVREMWTLSFRKTCQVRGWLFFNFTYASKLFCKDWFDKKRILHDL